MTSPVFKSPIPLNYLDTDTSLTANSDVKVATQKAVKAYADTKASALGADDNYVTDAEKTKLSNLSGTNTGDETVASQAEVATGTDNDKMVTPLAVSKFHIPPEGFLYNGKIVPSVASNNLTVAIKGLDGNNPSATNPVYVRIADTVHSITSALSFTMNAGTNWFNSGSAELATKEVDYFVYLGYNGTNVILSFARIVGYVISDFSGTTTNEKHIANQASYYAGNSMTIVGRFGATLSAGAGYTWSVPTFTPANLVQRPVFTTRWLVFDPTLTPSGSMTYGSVSELCYYQIKEDSICAIDVFLSGTIGGTPSTTVQMSLPVTPRGQYTTASGAITYATGTTIVSGFGANWDANTTLSLLRYDRGNLTAGNGNFQGQAYIKF